MTSAYSIGDYVADIREITRQESSEEAITRRIRPLAKRLAATPGWIRDEWRHCPEDQGFGVHLLHEEDDHSLAVFLISWLPDRGTLPHDHQTWAVVAGISGQEQEVEWRRLDDGAKPGYAKLERGEVRVMTAGDSSACMPGDIHSVWNVGDNISLSLHTYGKHINHTGRSEFDPEKNEERPFVVTVD